MIRSIIAALFVMTMMTFIFFVFVQKEEKPNNGISPSPQTHDTNFPVVGSSVVPVKEATAQTLSPTYKPSSQPVVVDTFDYEAQFYAKKAKGSVDFHFVHIPKCGGTSMTAILREVACAMDTSRNEDCCTNPGFCDFHAHRRCASIKGCINHFPQNKFLSKPFPSITIMREPISRLLSAWFYRGHSPNIDFFQVRPEFKEIKMGLRPKVVFSEYVQMHEYNNIQTRMLGADSFPYRDIIVDEELFEKAVESLNQFFFIGVQDAYEISVKVMLRELNIPSKHLERISSNIKKERDQGGGGEAKQKSLKKLSDDKKAILNNNATMLLARKANEFDTKLYQLGLKKFCLTIKKYDDLLQQLESTTKISCKKFYIT